MGLTRGRVQGETRKTNLLSIKTKVFIKGHQNNQLRQKAVLAGIFLATICSVGLVYPTHAYAASADLSGLDLAKKTIKNVAPLVSTQKTNITAASYVFTPDEFVQKPLITETQITVDPPAPVHKQPVKSYRTVNHYSAVHNIDTNNNSDISAHRFPYGYCTYYVSSHRYIPWSGNAISWLSGAISFGYATGSTPKVGAIMVTTEGGRTGHVALVDNVNSDGTFRVTEMNYAGFGVISSRIVSDSYGPIIGFIY